MYTKGDDSFKKVLEQFADGKMRSIERLYEIFGDEILDLAFGGHGDGTPVTLEDTVKSLADTDNYLKRIGKRYKITARGRQELALLIRREKKTSLGEEVVSNNTLGALERSFTPKILKEAVRVADTYHVVIRKSQIGGFVGTCAELFVSVHQPTPTRCYHSTYMGIVVAVGSILEDKEPLPPPAEFHRPPTRQTAA